MTNCLNSILLNNISLIPHVQVCISDNCSTDETEKIVSDAIKVIPIKYKRNTANLGYARNLLKVVEMADGEFVWVIGDDDLLMPDVFDELISLINNHIDVDYFYVNSNHLTTEYVFSFPQPFALSNLPQKMLRFSTRETSGEMEFLDLIDPKVSSDFLGGIFLSIFRRDKWIANAHVLDEAAIFDDRLFSHFDNTFPNIKIFAHAFRNSKAYFCAKPLSVCLMGAREWKPMSPLVKSVRLVEALKEYKKNGLSLSKYVYCKNSALNSFASDFVRMVIDANRSGYNYINPVRLIASNLIYPNFYLSFGYPLFRQSFWHKVMKYCSNVVRLFGKSSL